MFSLHLQVLYRFLEFFSNFDWDNFCVSLLGPVPISSLPDVTAEPPRKDSGELLLNKVFLDACSSVYAVFPGGQENQGQPFVSKHFNVIDPLRVSNNLGRSVSKGNFFRIRSAFAFGAKRLARLLNCPQENLVAEVNQFFTNTWDRHGSGVRPDAPDTDNIQRNNSSGKKLKEFPSRESEFEDTPSRSSSSQQSQRIPRALTQKGHANLKSEHLVNDGQRSPFARTRSSPELTDSYNLAPDGSHSGPASHHHNRRKNVEAEPPHFEGSTDSNNGLNLYQEEQDLVNMMASSGLHGFSGSQVHMPMNLAAGHLQFPVSPSFLAGMGYAQRNFSGGAPANFPFIDSAFAGMQFPHGVVSPQLSHFFSGVGVPSNSEDSNEPINGMSSGDADHNFWREQDAESVSFETLPPDDKRQPPPPSGLNYIPPPRRVGGSGGLVRSQQKSNKEKCGPLRDDHSDHVNDVFSDERTTSSRFSSAAHTNSLKSKTSSESSWDESVSTAAKPTKEKRGKKAVVPTESASGYVKGKTMFDPDDDDLDWVGSDPTGSHMSGPSGYEPAQTSGSDSMVPMGPMILGHNSRQRLTDNNSGVLPLTFYPTGPPVPFLTMLPFYNVPSQPGPSGPSDPSSTHFGVAKCVDNGDITSQTFQPPGLEPLEDYGPDSLRGLGPGEPPDEHKPDILNSDFASHWQNLQFGRFCQSPRQHGPAVYPSPLMVPPMYLQGRVPWDGPGRPMPNMNLVSQLMNYGPRLVPVAPAQSVSSRPPNVYPRYVEDLPRYRSGTGTYLPNPVAVRDRHSSNQRRGNYNHDRTENHIDREPNWTTNPKPRGSSRNHNRNQPDKSSSRLDRSMGSYRNDPFPIYQTQNGTLRPSSSQSGPANVAYGMYPLPGSNPGGLSANGSTVPSMVMVYPYEHNGGFAAHTEPLEFGSLGPVGFPGVNEQLPLGEGSRPMGTFEEHRLYGASVQQSSPDRPSSPRHQRRV